MAIQADNVLDLIATTLQTQPRLKFSQIAQELQRYHVLPNFFRKRRFSYEGGTGIQFRLMVGLPGGVENVGLYHEVSSARVDVMKTAYVPWRHTVTNYVIDDMEILMNASNANKIVDILTTARTAQMLSLAKHFEEDGWSKPSDSSDDTSPFGIPYWIVKNASTGFYGGNPAGFADGAAGVDSTAYPNWRNYTAQYASVTKSDLIAKWRTAFVKTDFQSPITKTPDFNTGDGYGFYTTYDAVINPMELILEGQNDNLGPDVARYDGQLVFRRIPVNWVPQLDSDTQNPVYGINWGVFKVVFLENMYLRERGPVRDVPNQPTVSRVHIQTSYNYICYDRRRNFVLATA